MKISDIVLNKYKPTEWKDNLIELPHVYKKEDLGNDLVKLNKHEGEVFQQGTAVEEIVMNNIEQGILNNNIYALSAIDAIKSMQLQMLILQAALMGNVNGDVFSDDLENIESIELSRGIFNKEEKNIYCVNSKGERITVNGYAIAIG